MSQRYGALWYEGAIMHRPHSKLVWGKDGLRGTILCPFSSDTTQVVVQLASGQQLRVPAETLVRQQDGSYYLPLSPAEVELYDPRSRAEPGEPLVVPVLVEELEVQKRVVETGKVRITQVVHERDVVIDEPLFREEVEVERVPIHRVVDGPIPVRYEDETLIVSVVEETLVVEKRLVLKEEWHIRKRCAETHQPQRVTLRSEEAQIERLRPTEEKEK
jgi:uncharacterized protein (TIGR02271 family)